MEQARLPMTDYYKRRIDGLIDNRLTSIEHQQELQQKTLTRLESRINYLFGAIGVLIVIVNLLAPIVTKLIP
uniref:Uncharacterized protein n=1 Tax=viral metagenome TaxID=1070528 RepID=A0A6M3LPY4_9ZZZZ